MCIRDRSRINTRIERLESSFQTEMTALKQENVKLRHTLAEIQQSPKNINKPKDIVLEEETTRETEPLNEIVENFPLTKSTAKPVVVFNHSTYMTGVFAYQRTDNPYNSWFAAGSRRNPPFRNILFRSRYCY